jgi:uncharacterized protein YciI
VSYFAVWREAGPAWERESGIADQPGVSDHAAFMNQLADEGFVLIAGPLGGTESGHLRVLLIVNAGTPAEIYGRLAGDPWVTTGQIQVVSIEPWSVLIGEGRLAEPGAARR